MCPSTLKALVTYSLAEFWIGKSRQIRANSILELFGALALSALVAGALFLRRFHGRNPNP